MSNWTFIQYVIFGNPAGWLAGFMLGIFFCRHVTRWLKDESVSKWSWFVFAIASLCIGFAMWRSLNVPSAAS